MLLETRQPLDLALSLKGGQAFRWRREGEWYRGVVGRLVLRLRRCPEGIEAHALAPLPAGAQGAEASGPGVASSQDELLRCLLARYFRLDDDLVAIYQAFSDDEALVKAVAACWGLRLLRQDPWECLASFICSVDSNIPRITGTVERLAQSFGEPLTAEGVAYAFPTPDAVAEAGEEALRRLGLGFRAPYLWRTAQRVVQEDVALKGLCSLPYGEAREWLLSLPGVGEKVADCVLAFSVDRLEAFPIDRWVRRALEEVYLEGRHLPKRALRRWAGERFGPLSAYAQQYLFQWRRGL